MSSGAATRLLKDSAPKVPATVDRPEGVGPYGLVRGVDHRLGRHRQGLQRRERQPADTGPDLSLMPGHRPWPGQMPSD